jgi:sodium/proline symporter
VTALSAQAADMSGWLLMGLPGLAYMSGFGEAFLLAVGLSLGTYLNWKVVAKKFRQYTQAANDSLTISDYFENRFHDKTHVLRITAALFNMIFFTLYTASGFIASGKLFNSVFGMPYEYAVLIGGGVLVLYTFLGGFFAVNWADFIQGMIMLFAAIVVPVVAVIHMGGFGNIAQALTAQNSLAFSIFSDTAGHPLGLIAVISAAAWGLGYFGMPHILVRFMSIEKPQEIADSRRIAMTWLFVSLGSAVLIGIAGRAYTIAAPLSAAKAETIFIVLSQGLFNSFLAGVMMSAILAAIMSTAASQLLVASSGISEDFYKALIRKNASAKETLWVGRISVLLISFAAYLFSLKPDSSIFKVVSFAWAGLGATFGPVILLSLFWRRATAKGAFAGIIVGGVSVLVWKNLAPLGGLFTLYEIVPGFILSVLSIIIVSLIDKEPPREVTDMFDKMQSAS